MRRILAVVLMLSVFVVARSGPATALPPPEPTFHGLTPARLADTRASGETIDGAVEKVGALGPGATLQVPILGRGGVPGFSVGSVALNVTAINPSAPSFVTVYPTGANRPNASNLNLAPGRTLPNMVIVPLGDEGSVTLYNDKGSTHVAVDVLGWFPPQFTFQGLTPARLADTRTSGATIDDQLEGVGPLTAGGTLDVPVAGRGGVPGSGAGAVALNVTAINPTAPSFITAYPKGATRPNASNLNLDAGRTLPNMVIVPLGDDGSVTLYNDKGSTNAAVDVLGWFPTGWNFTGLTPARLADTRTSGKTVDGDFEGDGPLGEGGSMTIGVTGRGGVMGYGVGSVVLNVTAINPSAPSFLTVYPGGATRPNASNLNLAPGRTLPNMVVVPVGTGGVTIYNDKGSTHVAVDVLGWFPHTVHSPYTHRVNVTTEFAQAVSGVSSNPSISARGHQIAYASTSQLVAEDTNGLADIYVYDDTEPSTTRVSVATGAGQANGASANPSISANGRYVAFESSATNLVGGDDNLFVDIFVHDRVTGVTELVSTSSTGIQGNGDSTSPSISGDGRYVAFASTAENLVLGDGNLFVDIFVKDRITGAITRANVSTAGVAANGASANPAISASGRVVAFDSGANNLVVGDSNGTFDVFVRDLDTDTTTRVSVVTGGAQAVGGNSTEPSISADGWVVAFTSAATNLTPGDGNGASDVFARDRRSGVTRVMSRTTGGALGNNVSRNASISGDGRYVAFSSVATNLVGSIEVNGHEDVYVHDRFAGDTARMSQAVTDPEANGVSTNPSVSGDGRYVAFDSTASNLVIGDTNGLRDVFFRNQGTTS